MAPGQESPASIEEAPLKTQVIPSPAVGEAKDNGFYAGPSDAEDQEIDVLDCKKDGALELMKAEDPNATEQSSSFDGTFSGSGDGSKMDLNDSEVNSGSSALNEKYSRVFQKKKVTDHWRRYIRPIMWRCHWLELHMKELRSQASIYAKELQTYKLEKLLHKKAVELDNSASRLVPLICQSQRNRAMKRKKRKRIEDTVDLSLYMSNHNIFSYYENKRPETDGHLVDDNCQDQEAQVNDDLGWSLLRFRHQDGPLEEILLGIEAAISRVANLNCRISEVLCRNYREISSVPDDSFLGGQTASRAQSPSLSHGNDGVSECEMEDMAMAESYGDAADLDESSTGLFVSDICIDHNEIGYLREDIDDDDVLINNRAAEEELQSFEVMEKPQQMVREEVGSPKASTTELQLEAEEAAMPEPPVSKPPYTGKRRGRKPKKRRRGGATFHTSAHQNVYKVHVVVPGVRGLGPLVLQKGAGLFVGPGDAVGHVSGGVCQKVRLCLDEG